MVTRNTLAMFVRTFVLAAFLVVAFQNSAFAEWKEFEVSNNSGFAISEFYMSDTNYDNWGDNLLDKVLENGDSIKLTYDTDRKNYDVKVVFQKGQVIEWSGDNCLDLSGACWIMIYYDGRADDGSDCFCISIN